MLMMRLDIGVETRCIRKYGIAIGGLTHTCQWLLIVKCVMSAR